MHTSHLDHPPMIDYHPSEPGAMYPPDSTLHASHLDHPPNINYHHLSEPGAMYPPDFYPPALNDVAHTETHWGPSESDTAQHSYFCYPPIHPTAPQPHDTYHHHPIVSHTLLDFMSHSHSTPMVTPYASSHFMHSFTDAITAPAIADNPTAPPYSDTFQSSDEEGVLYQRDLIPLDHSEQSFALNDVAPSNKYIEGCISETSSPSSAPPPLWEPSIGMSIPAPCRNGRRLLANTDIILYPLVPSVQQLPLKHLCR